MTTLLVAVAVIFLLEHLVLLYVAARRWQLRHIWLKDWSTAVVGSDEFKANQAMVKRMSEHLRRLGFASRSGAALDELIEISFRMHSTAEMLCIERSQGQRTPDDATMLEQWAAKLPPAPPIDLDAALDDARDRSVPPDRYERAVEVASHSKLGGTDSVELLRELRENGE